MNPDALLYCKPENYSGGWTGWPLSDAVYNPFMTAVTQSGYTPLIYYYDWRKDPRILAQGLRDFIVSHTGNSEKVYLVGHSMGGLVGRSLIEQNLLPGKIEKFMSVGTPHKGIVNTYPAWSNDVVIGSVEWRTAGMLVVTACRQYRRVYEHVIRQFVPSVQTMLPVFDYLIYKKAPTLTPYADMQTLNPWLTPLSFRPPFGGIPFGSLSGTSYPTYTELSVKQPPEKETGWLDGKIYGEPVTSDKGDNTVLVDSSRVDGADNYILPLDHGAVMSSPAGIASIFSFLGISGKETGMSMKPEIDVSPQSLLLVVADRSGFSLTDPKGGKYPDSHNSIAIVNPPAGNYSLTLNPTLIGRTFYILQVLEKNITLVKSYSFRSLLTQTKTLHFDPASPLSDPLQ